MVKIGEPFFRRCRTVPLRGFTHMSCQTMLRIDWPCAHAADALLRSYPSKRSDLAIHALNTWPKFGGGDWTRTNISVEMLNHRCFCLFKLTLPNSKND